MDRIILHCDCNCFYASCELLSHPDLRNLPVAVCGDPTERHGIILAKNEPAKRCGVKTAETIWKAKQKCPGLMLVYASAYLEFALEGYTVNAYRYLLKRDIARTLPKCLDDLLAALTDQRKTLTAHHNRTETEIPLDQIYYLESDLRQINVYGDIARRPICTYYGKIADLPPMLYENGFLQVSRSDVVNMKYVRSIRSYRALLKNGVELSVSRAGYAAIQNAYLEWKGQYVDE